MRVILFCFMIFLFGSHVVVSQSQIPVNEVHKINLKWESSYKNAVKRAKKENKPILIYFSGSDWCGVCINLEKNLFHTAKFKTYSDKKLVLYLADFPRNKNLVSREVAVQNNKLAKKYRNSFPMVLLVNKKGKVLGERRGKYLIDSYFPFFESVVKKYR